MHTVRCWFKSDQGAVGWVDRNESATSSITQVNKGSEGNQNCYIMTVWGPQEQPQYSKYKSRVLMTMDDSKSISHLERRTYEELVINMCEASELTEVLIGDEFYSISKTTDK